MTIPFESQIRPRLCGAAALTMAYRALGLEATQDEVWPSVAGKNRRGDDCARTHRLAADALRRGLAAVVIQALDPWSILASEPVKAVLILNHRPTPAAWTGHFTVLVQRGPDAVVVHDPQFGPFRRHRPRRLPSPVAADRQSAMRDQRQPARRPGRRPRARTCMRELRH